MITIQIGNHATHHALKAAVQHSGCAIGVWIHELWPQVSVNKERAIVRLTATSITELGIGQAPNWQQAHDRILELGHHECPSEVGPILAIDWKRFGETPMLLVMKPLLGGNDCPYVFFIEHGTLNAYHVHPGRALHPNMQLIFIAGA